MKKKSNDAFWWAVAILLIIAFTAPRVAYEKTKKYKLSRIIIGILLLILLGEVAYTLFYGSH